MILNGDPAPAGAPARSHEDLLNDLVRAAQVLRSPDHYMAHLTNPPRLAEQQANLDRYHQARGARPDAAMSSTHPSLSAAFEAAALARPTTPRTHMADFHFFGHGYYHPDGQADARCQVETARGTRCTGRVIRLLVTADGLGGHRATTIGVGRRHRFIVQDTAGDQAVVRTYGGDRTAWPTTSTTDAT